MIGTDNSLGGGIIDTTVLIHDGRILRDRLPHRAHHHG